MYLSPFRPSLKNVSRIASRMKKCTVSACSRLSESDQIQLRFASATNYEKICQPFGKAAGCLVLEIKYSICLTSAVSGAKEVLGPSQEYSQN